MFRLACMLVAVLLWTTAQSATLQGPTDSALVEPGGSITVAFTVTGTGRAERIDPSVTLPDGWRLLVPETAFGLAADGRAVRLITLAVPSQARAGEHEVRYRVGDDEAVGIVRVNPQPRVQLDVRQLPEVIARGATLELEIGLYNAGNTEVVPILLLDDSRGVMDTPPVPVAPMEPGDTRVVPVTLQTRRSGGAVDLRIVAEHDGQRIGRLTTTIVTAVEQDGQWSSRVPIPGGISAGGWMRTVSGEVDVGPLVQATLSGHIDDDKTHHINAVVRAPDAVGITSVGYLRDEYRAEYRFDDGVRSAHVRLGDSRHAFSDILLQTGRQRGASFDADLGRVRVGGVAVRDRFVSQPRTLAGPRAGVDITDNLFLGATLLYAERLGDQGVIAAHNGELSAAYRSGRTALQYQVAWGGAPAASAQLRARFGPVNLTLSGRYSDPDYLGEWAGQRALFGSGSLRVGRRTTVSLGTSLLDDEGDRRLAIPRAYQMWSANGQVAHRLSNATRLTFRWRHRTAQASQPILLDRAQDVGTIGVATRGALGQLDVSTSTRIERDVTYGQGTLQQLTVRIGTPSGSPLSATSQISYLLPVVGQSQTREQVRVSGGVRAALADRVDANAQYTLTAFPGRGIDALHYARGRIALTTPWEHVVSVWADVLVALGPTRSSALATYTVPFSLKGGRRGDAGAVLAEVVHTDGTPVPDVQLRYGDFLGRTDPTGRVVFNGLPDKPEALRLVESTLPAGEMVSGTASQRVRPMPPGQLGDPIRFEVASAGSLQAEVRSYELLNPLQVRLGSEPAEYRPTSPVVGAQLILIQGETELKAVTNTAGIVSFDRVPAGRWFARLSLPASLPDQRIEQPRFVVDIEAERSASYTLRVLPNIAPLQMLVDSPVPLTVGGRSDDPQPTRPTTLTQVQVRPETLVLDTGQTGALRATAVMSDDAIQSITDDAEWRSTNPRVARVNGAGRVEALAPGSAAVTAAYDGMTSNTAQVEVIDVPVVGLSLDVAEVLLAPGQTKQLTVQAVYVDGRIRDATQTVRWVTTDPDVAMVDVNGLVRATGFGTAEISAEISGVRAFPATVVVGDVTALTLSLPKTRLRVGQSVRPMVRASLASGEQQDVTSLVTWQVAEPSILRAVGPSLSAQAPGQTSVTAMFSGRPSNTLQMQVLGPVGLIFTPDLFAMPAGESIRLDVQAIYADGETNAVSGATWRSLNEDIATISADGVLVAQQAGQVRLQVQGEGTTSERTIQVVSGSRTLRANIAEQRVETGDTQLRVIAEYSDGTEVDVTPWVDRWQSSNPEVGRVNTRGIVSITDTGTTEITATLDGERIVFTLNSR